MLHKNQIKLLYFSNIAHCAKMTWYEYSV